MIHIKIAFQWTMARVIGLQTKLIMMKSTIQLKLCLDVRTQTVLPWHCFLVTCFWGMLFYWTCWLQWCRTRSTIWLVKKVPIAIDGFSVNTGSLINIYENRSGCRHLPWVSIFFILNVSILNQYFSSLCYQVLQVCRIFKASFPPRW